MTITDDDVREDAETFIATLEMAFNESVPKILIRPAMVTVTILDNDGKDMLLLHLKTFFEGNVTSEHFTCLGMMGRMHSPP